MICKSGKYNFVVPKIQKKNRRWIPIVVKQVMHVCHLSVITGSISSLHTGRCKAIIETNADLSLIRKLCRNVQPWLRDRLPSTPLLMHWSCRSLPFIKPSTWCCPFHNTDNIKYKKYRQPWNKYKFMTTGIIQIGMQSFHLAIPNNLDYCVYHCKSLMSRHTISMG